MSSLEKLPLVELNREDEPTRNISRPWSENILRPKHLLDYIGQKSVCSKLEIFMEAAKRRKASLDHVILSGPPGLGKTTLAHIVAEEMGSHLHLAAGPSLEKTVDLLAILTNLQEGDVLFIDEIHRLNSVVEETLYPAMEDFTIQMIVGEGAASQSISVPVQKFTLIGATTQMGRLTGPLRDRFGIQLHLDFYSEEEMFLILKRSAGILGAPLKDSELSAIAKRSRGTPRIANRLLCRVRDYLEVMRSGTEVLSAKTQQELLDKGMDQADVAEALDFLDVDRLGLQPLDRRYLQVLMEQFKGGPAGVEALAASLSEDRSTLEEMVEPYLLKQGFLVRTPRGRQLTDRAYTLLSECVTK